MNRRRFLLLVLPLFVALVGIGCKPKVQTGVPGVNPGNAAHKQNVQTAGPSVQAAAPSVIPVDADAGPINLLTMGDWGDNSTRQHQVAQTMANYVAGTKVKFQGMLLAGDNFRGMLNSVDDPAWQDIFEKAYDPKILDMPFFAALGNHDYEDNKAQIEFDYARKNPQSRWKQPARWYRIDIPANKPSVVVLMLDSNRDKISDGDWAAQIKWIDEQLTSVPAGAWTIACAHHPLFSNGTHGDNGVLISDWGPIFKQHHLSFYVCGHDHDLQHLEIDGWPMSFVLAGGGGAGTRVIRRDDRGPFSKKINGFAHLQFTDELATVRYISSDGTLLHAFTRNKAGEVKTISNSGSDRATSKPLQAIQGVGPFQD